MPIVQQLSKAAALAALSLVAPAALAQQVVKPPVARYAIDLSTRNMSIPGMPAGMPAMMMGGGMGAGPGKELYLGLATTQKAAAPEADHDIPPGMAMGPSLPLRPPPAATGARREMPDDERTPEKPKARMLVYWGCGSAVRAGQPKVADTEKMSPAQFGEALRGRAPPERGNLRNAQLRWPNERDTKAVPASASIRGEQLVHGNATPDIRFTIDERHDFLAPLELAASGDPAGPVALEWKAIANAQGYFLQAIGHRESTGEMIVWSSSDMQDAGFGLMTWLPNEFRRRMIEEKVVLPPTTTRCEIPAGIFAGAEGAVVQAIAYGDELNLVHPRPPADPKLPWEQLWTVRLRVKSTGMVPLGIGEVEPARAEQPGGTGAQAPAQAQPANPVDEAVKGLKGLFKF